MSQATMCDLFPNQEAVYRYSWPWDESGFCSEAGARQLRQTAANLARDVEIQPIQQIVPQLTRDERTRLIAEKLSAESEREDTQQRASKLYDHNLVLSEEVNILRTRIGHLEAVEKGLRGELAQAHEECTRLSVEAGKLGLEVHHHKLLMAANPEADFNELQGMLADAHASVAALRVREGELVETLERTRNDALDANAKLRSELEIANGKLAAAHIVE